MLLHVKGFDNGFCFMLDDKAVSVLEALDIRGRKFNKRTVDALDRRNLPNTDFLESFERKAKVLYTGLDAMGAIQLLRDKGIDFEKDYFLMSDVTDLVHVYNISKYRAPSSKFRNGSQMRYFYAYLQKELAKANKTR